MASVQATSNEGECHKSFSFDQWINDNELEEVKTLLIKHEMRTVATLSTQTQQFSKFMSDPQLFSKMHLVQRIITSIQNVPLLYKDQQNEYIVVSEEEHNVMDKMKAQLTTLTNIESKLKDLEIKYPQSIERLNTIKYEQIENTKNKITALFEDIINTFKFKQNAVLNELQKITKRIQSDHDAHNDDDNKENDILLASVSMLKNERKAINNAFKVCDDMIKTKKNKERKKRKEGIINIGKEMTNKFNITQQTLQDNINNVDKLITNNTNTVINIDFIANTKTLNRIKRGIDNIGIVVNDEYVPSKQKRKQYKCKDDEDDIRIKKLEIDIKNHKQQYATLQQELTVKTQQYIALETGKQQKDEAIQSLQNRIQSHIQSHNALQTQLNGVKEEVIALKSQKQQSLLALKQNLSFDRNTPYRWYQCDEKQDDVPVKTGNNNNVTRIGFSDGAIKENISANSISLTPNTNNMNGICRIIKNLTFITQQKLNGVSLFGFKGLDSVLLKESKLKRLFRDNVLPQSFKTKQFSLLYRASVHGLKRSTFHSRCDNQGATLVIIATKEYERIFGGYTSISWQNSGGYKEDKNAFVYFVSGKENKAQRVPNKSHGSNAIYCHHSCAVCFGGAGDIGWWNDRGTNGNCSRSYYDYSSVDQTPLAGAANGWSVKEYEVWKVE